MFCFSTEIVENDNVRAVIFPQNLAPAVAPATVEDKSGQTQLRLHFEN